MSTTISPVSALAGTTATDPSTTTPTTTSGSSLGINDFMQLLATQFQEQDPMQPMDDTAFIAQTAQFTALQQTNTLVQQMTQLSAAQNLTTANGYIGRNVTVTTGNSGQTVSGNVTAVDASGTEPQLIINGTSYPLSSVTMVAPGTTSDPTPVTSPAVTPAAGTSSSSSTTP
jgi:flagellar basal-body rod modification protein FlgD